MAQSHHLNITLSDEAVQFMRNKASSGEYASESEVIDRGLEVLREEADALARFEREVIVPAYDRLRANPSLAITAEAVEQHLQARRDARANKSTAG